jgi:hypothetical protein
MTFIKLTPQLWLELIVNTIVEAPKIISKFIKNNSSNPQIVDESSSIELSGDNESFDNSDYLFSE